LSVEIDAVISTWIQSAFIATDTMVAFMVCWSFFFHHADTLQEGPADEKSENKKTELGMLERLQNNG